jgi:hypothetical protein
VDVIDTADSVPRTDYRNSARGLTFATEAPTLRRLVRPLAYLLAARVSMLAALGLLRPLTHAWPFELGFWDGSWYLKAAEHGWPHTVPMAGGQAAESTLAFFPGFPMLIRLVHFVLGTSWMASGALTAFVCQVFMVVAVWWLAADYWNPDSADRAILALCFFPGAFILALMYSEPLMIGLSALCLLYLRRQWWVPAGVAAGLAAATRPNAVALIAACAWAAGSAILRDRDWKSLAAVVLAPTGLIAWFAYLTASTGSVLAWMHTEEGGWGDRLEPLAPVHLFHSDLVQGVLRYPNLYVTAVSTLGALALVILLVRTPVPAPWIVFSAVVLIMALFSKELGLRPRFVMTAFPLVLVLGARLRRSDYLGLVTGAGAVLMTGLLVLSTTGIALVP